MSEPKDVVLAYVDAFNRGDLDGVCRLFATGAQVWGVLGWGTLDVARPVWKDLMECRGISLTVESIIAEGAAVAVRYIERGTSMHAFRGLGPTGKSYELIAMEWFEIKDGLIQKRWGARDSASQNRQLGFTP